MNKTLLIIVLVWCLGVTSLFGSDNRPRVYFAVTRIADEDTKEDSWIAMGRKPPVADDMPNCWYWYPRYGKPFFAVVTPITVSDFAIFAVKFNWDIKDADARHRNLQYVEAKWDTPTPFTYDGRKFVLFASLKSLEYVKEKTYPNGNPSRL
jgi:hypothetical protein